MKIKLDENLPSQLARILEDLGHDVHTLRDEGLDGQSDEKVWEAAQKDSRFLITPDLDFSDARRFVPGSHNGILLVRLHSPSRRSLMERIRELFENENLSEWVGCFIVATERKIRMQKPDHTRSS